MEPAGRRLHGEATKGDPVKDSLRGDDLFGKPDPGLGYLPVVERAYQRRCTDSGGGGLNPPGQTRSRNLLLSSHLNQCGEEVAPRDDQPIGAIAGDLRSDPSPDLAVTAGDKDVAHAVDPYHVSKRSSDLQERA